MKCELTDDLKKAMEVKYGDGKTTSEIDTVTCTYTFTGARNKKVEATIIKEWKNGNIVVNAVRRGYYNDKCEEQYLSYFDLCEKDMAELFTLEEIAAEKNLKEAISQKNKSDIKEKIKDF